MSNFIELTNDEDGEKVYVNKYHVTSFAPFPNKKTCYVTFSNNRTLIARNTYKQIKEKLNADK